MRESAVVELEAVVAVSRRGSFRPAAVELGMSPTALSRAVNGLEARLGVRLFNRTTRSVSLSEAGEQFIARVAPALSEIRSAMEGVNDLRDKPAGTVLLKATVKRRCASAIDARCLDCTGAIGAGAIGSPQLRP